MRRTPGNGRVPCIAVALLMVSAAVPAPAASEILAWRGSEADPHPCLYLTTNDLARARTMRADLGALAGKTSWRLESDRADMLIAGALLAGSASARQTVIAEALVNLDKLLAKIPATIERNAGPHGYGREFGRAAGLADAALADPDIRPEDRAAILAKLAQIGYLVNSVTYWDPPSGKCNLCPNITTTAWYYRLVTAALIPSHPMAETWFDTAWNEMTREMDEWMDPAGGMLECPHYAMVIFDQWAGAAIVAHNAGLPAEETVLRPALRKAIEWFANVSTPPDPRNGGFRRFPSLGHTYADERTSAFGLMAYLWRDADPEFAATMQWMHRQHGPVDLPGKYTYFPAQLGYRGYLLEPSLGSRAPDYGTACYPETGIVFRNSIGSDRETMLYLVAGRNHSHYFNDSGSITLWGKGRELLDEDDYKVRRGPEAQQVHSMVDHPATFNGERVMAIREFSASDVLDYARGTRRGWQRQIAFVKDPDPLGPNYFLLADTLDVASVPTTWRLFVAAERITVHGPRVTVTGRDDVDLDIVFISPRGVEPVAASNHISVAVTASGTLRAVLYPRLRSGRRPRVTPVADGRGATVVTAAGTDLIVMGPEPFAFGEGDDGFETRVALVRTRPDEQLEVAPGACEVAPGWEGGDRELRTIRWDGPQYPVFPDE